MEPRQPQHSGIYSQLQREWPHGLRNTKRKPHLILRDYRHSHRLRLAGRDNWTGILHRIRNKSKQRQSPAGHLRPPAVRQSPKNNHQIKHTLLTSRRWYRKFLYHRLMSYIRTTDKKMPISLKGWLLYRSETHLFVRLEKHYLTVTFNRLNRYQWPDYK